MFSYVNAIVVDNETIIQGDTVRVIYYNEETREGIFKSIEQRYKSLHIMMEDKELLCGFYDVSIPFRMIKNIEKID